MDAAHATANATGWRDIANTSGWCDWGMPAVTHSSRSLNDTSKKQRTDTSGKDKWWTYDNDEVSRQWHVESGGWYAVSDGRSAARSSNDSWYVVNENTIRPWPNATKMPRAIPLRSLLQQHRLRLRRQSHELNLRNG